MITFPTRTIAGQIDDFVWRNPLCVILFAGGNSGRGHNTNTISRQGSARNCITVGASESSRVVANSTSTASPGTIAYFSSCGPTRPGGQIKPDIVAPGTDILSALSTALDDLKKPRRDPTDKRWQFMNGTSMATPLVAGCVAVLRQALKCQRGFPNHLLLSSRPSSSTALTVFWTQPPIPKNDDPNNTTGFGRVNMSTTLSHIGNQGNQASPPLAGFG